MRLKDSSAVSVYAILAIGILCLGIAIRLMGLDKGIWVDEYYSLKVIFSPDMFKALPLYDNQPPVYLMLLKEWSATNSSEEFLRLLSVVFGMGTLIFMMLWLKGYSSAASLLGGFVCATMPILLRYSQELRSYPLLLFATALSYFFASRIIDRPEKTYQYLCLSLSLSLVAVSHLIGIMSVTSVGVFMLVSFGNLSKILNRRLIITFLVPGFVFLYIYFVVTPWIPDRTNWWMPPLSADLAVSTSRYVLGVDALQRLIQTAAANHPTLANLLAWAAELVSIGWVICLAILGCWRRSLPFLAAAGFYVVQVVAYTIFVTPIFWYRTLLPALVPLLGFLALQIATTKIEKIKWASTAILILVCLGFTISWITSESKTPYEPWKQAAQILQSNYQTGNLVVFYPGYIEGPFRYYATFLTSDKIISVNVGESVEELRKDLADRIGFATQEMSPTVFLIVRTDGNVAKDGETYQGIMRYLQNQFGQKAFGQNLGIIVISKYEFHNVQ